MDTIAYPHPEIGNRQIASLTAFSPRALLS
jgi:hypothetical protein